MWRDQIKFKVHSERVYLFHLVLVFKSVHLQTGRDFSSFFPALLSCLYRSINLNLVFISQRMRSYERTNAGNRRACSQYSVCTRSNNRPPLVPTVRSVPFVSPANAARNIFSLMSSMYSLWPIFLWTRILFPPPGFLGLSYTDFKPCEGHAMYARQRAVIGTMTKNRQSGLSLEKIRSRTITEFKQCWDWLVLGREPLIHGTRKNRTGTERRFLSLSTTLIFYLFGWPCETWTDGQTDRL